jgi:hypothetical protein
MTSANIDLALMDRGNFTFNGIGLDCNFRHIMEALEDEEYTMEDGFAVIYTGDVDVVAEVEAAKINEKNIQYQKYRAFSYPSLQDQADMQYHDQVNGTTTWKDAIAAIKTKYPKIPVVD